MLNQLNKYWRIAATGFCFSLFGLGGFILPWLAIPILYLLPGGNIKRELRAKALLHYSFRAFVETMRIVGVLSYSVEDQDQLNQPGQLIFANHPSLIDVVFLIAFIKKADCVVKSELLRNPFMRGPIQVAGYIANDDPERVIELTTASLKRGNSLIVFPEGTRTTPGLRVSMRRGAANIALRSSYDITPVIINCQPTTLTKEQKWYQVPERRMHISITLRPVIPVRQFQQDIAPTRAARKLTHFLEQYFTQELAINERT